MIWRQFGRFARRRTASVILVFVLAFAGSAIITLTKGVPEPYFTDEHSYLLAADTFSQGRLTNPTHPMWVHFESFHINQQPTYASKFPPGQGLFLALGQVLTGYPIVGVWLSMALMCAAITWMLQAWIPARWALIGGLISIFHLYLGIASYWGQSYMGGAVAAFGGALFFGAWRRLIRKPDFKISLVLALGLAVMANSRPWEGFVVCAPALVVLIVFIIQRATKGKFKEIFNTAITPIATVIIIIFAAMGYYNYRVTGNAFLTSYQVHQETYDIAPHFIWQEPRLNRTYNHKVISDFQRYLRMKRYERYLSPEGFTGTTIWKLKTMWTFFGSVILGIPIICALFWIFRDRWLRFACFTILIYLVATIFSTFFNTYYTAPIVCLVFLLIMQGLRVISRVRISRNYIGKYIVSLILIICIGLFVRKFTDLPSQKYLRKHYQNIQITELVKGLKKEGGDHLVIVRYVEGHDPRDEWVYNEADIDRSSIVWAREMDQENNRKLLKYFKGRKAWLLIIGPYNSPVRFYSYPK